MIIDEEYWPDEPEIIGPPPDPLTPVQRVQQALNALNRKGFTLSGIEEVNVNVINPKREITRTEQMIRQGIHKKNWIAR